MASHTKCTCTCIQMLQCSYTMYVNTEYIMTHTFIAMVMVLIKCCSIVFWWVIQQLLPGNQQTNTIPKSVYARVCVCVCVYYIHTLQPLFLLFACSVFVHVVCIHQLCPDHIPIHVHTLYTTSGLSNCCRKMGCLMCVVVLFSVAMLIIYHVHVVCIHNDGDYVEKKMTGSVFVRVD